MTLAGTLINSTWTPYAQNIINRGTNNEQVYYYISDSSTLIPGYIDWAQNYIKQVDAIIDLDFIETGNINNSTISFHVRNHIPSDENILGRCSLKGTWIEADTYLSNRATTNSNYNTFIHEFGHALGLGEPGYDTRWDQDDTSMSYNSSDITGDFNITYTSNDWDALLSIWGSEDHAKSGDSAANLLFGQRGDTPSESIYGLDGSDLIFGFGGKDSLIGGNGSDTIYGGYGGDILDGGNQDDEIYGSHGSDYILGRAGSDNVFAGQGADTIFGGSGADFIRGGGGPNNIDAGENDGQQDHIYIYTDVETNGRPNDGSFMDLVENIEENDRIYILGNEIIDNLGFVDNGNFVDIYHNNSIEARLLNTDLNSSQVEEMTSFF
ncbi:Peptidase, metallopeptidase [Synechococcus sp. BL107]|uniref:Peptidase, metallopeptidase n=1 Tax=Synechococcus sp. BL107 TaxID=313625 RepID=UPI0000E5445C|nr:Peptidase, metallopeptidase [Synechococcus sp. BL107]EAU72533.1 Peptidase, metallopeptidase [Synechococcus sp. BL107]